METEPQKSQSGPHVIALYHRDYELFKSRKSIDDPPLPYEEKLSFGPYWKLPEGVDIETVWETFLNDRSNDHLLTFSDKLEQIGAEMIEELPDGVEPEKFVMI